MELKGIENQGLNKGILDSYIKQIFSESMRPSRGIVVQTGPGGYELFDEKMTNELGYTRIWLTKKPLRLLKNLKGKIHKSITGKYYRDIKNK